MSQQRNERRIIAEVGSIRAATIGSIQAVILSVGSAISWFATDFLPSDIDKTLFIFFLAVIVLFPVKYREVAYLGQVQKNKDKTSQGQKRYYWIRMPFIFAGLCELFIVIADRFKTSPK